MNSAHTPSRRQSIIFFLLTLGLAIGIILWSLWLNRGTLIIMGQTPFLATVGDEEHECGTASCEIKLKPANYTVILKKEGFFENQKEVRVRRWQTTKLTAEFQFMPALREVGTMVLPLDSAPLRPPFLGNEKLPNLPKNIHASAFSHSGEKILLTLGKEIYIYDVASTAVRLTPITPDEVPAWSGDEIFFLENEDGKQALKKLAGENINTIVVFERPFKKVRILGNASGAHVLIIEEETLAHYLIDIEKKTRRRLEGLPLGARAIAWTMSAIIFEVPTDSEAKKIVVMHSEHSEREGEAPNRAKSARFGGGDASPYYRETQKFKTFPAVDGENFIEREKAIFVFFSAEKQDDAHKQASVSIKDALEQAKKESTTALASAPKTFYLTEYSEADGRYKTLVSLTVSGMEKISRLNVASDGKTLYFARGEKAFSVILEN